MGVALEGVKILDLTRLMPFEYSTLLLADFGAEVLKVEEPKVGDYMRWMAPKLKKESGIFCMCNRNKKSMTLNLKTEEGKNIIRKLVKKYDVLFESFRPGVMKKLGLDYDSLREINPRLIFCSATGYGQSGPYYDRPGHDINYISIAGILEATGKHTGKPVIPGITISDMAIGIFSAYAMLVGIIARNRTGMGQYIDMSMTDCMVSFNMLGIASYISKKYYGSSSLDVTGETICYNVFKTKDNRCISFGNLEERFWTNFLKLIGREDLKEYQFTLGEKRDQIMDELQKIFIQKTREEWLTLLEGQDICYSPVNTIEDLLNDPHIKYRQMFFEMEHPIEGKVMQVRSPFNFSETPVEARTPSPSLGEHTEEILKDYGYSSKEINELRGRGVI